MKYRFLISALIFIPLSTAVAQMASHAPTAVAKKLTTAPAATKAPADPKTPVARVNGTVLTEMDLMRELFTIFPYAAQHDGIPKSMEPEMRKGALAMIEFEELVYQEALRRKLPVSAETLKVAESKMRGRFTTQQEFDQFVQVQFGTRADSRINEINRSVAASSGAELVDAEEIFSQASPDNVIGSELVYEHVHMTPEGNYLLARSIFLQIASQLAPARQMADIPSRAQCEHWLALTGHDRVRIAREMFGRLQKPPFTNQLNHSEQLLRVSWMAQVPDENPEETAAEYDWAIRQRPDDRMLRFSFGRFLFGYNRQAAADQLRMSRPWDDFPVFAPDGSLL
jgi:hypothetical protein